MDEIIGTSNRFLEIDLGSREVKTFPLSDQDRRLFLGGKGLGLKLLYDRMPPKTDPLGKDNYLAFMPGILMGTGAPCSGRFSAVTKSPLTGIMVSSSCGGPFGMAFKTAGYDGLLITGKAETPVYLIIDDKGVRFESASDLWGMDTKQTQQAIGSSKKSGVLAIGPAGENLAPIANIASGERFLGRGGMGAVMGSKNLKAIVAEGGQYRILPKDPGKFEKAKKRATNYINKNDVTSGAYRNFGTGSHVEWCNKGGILPVNNFQGGSHESASRVSGETMKQKYHSKHNTCKPCTILCGHKGTHEDGTEHQIPEYETVGLLGPNLGIFDPDLITEWNDLCGLMGMDTISAGAVLAYIMEAGEKGLVETSLAFGAPEGVSSILKDMANGNGFAGEMAKGVRWLSEKYGGETFAIHIKGLEMAAYDPRGAWGQGLAYAVANRGACHLSSALFALEVSFGLLNPYSTRAKAKFAHYFENLYATVNSLHTCQFTAFAYTLEPPIVKYTPKYLLGLTMQFMPDVALMLMDVSLYSKFFSAVTGIKMSQWEYLKAGKRIHTLERLMNCEEGISRKDDTLPDRFLKEGRTCDPEKRVVPLNKMLDAYYKVRGYDADGRPSQKTLKTLGIKPRTTPEIEVMGSSFRIVPPGKKPLKRLYLAIMLWFVGRAIQAASRVDKGVREEFKAIPDGYKFSLGVLPDGPMMIIGKEPSGKVNYLGSKPNGMHINLKIGIKNLEAAILLFTFQESTAASAARDRLVVDGDIPQACAAVRILNMVEVFLLPGIIAKLAVKRYPIWGTYRKHMGRFLIYIRTVAGF